MCLQKNLETAVKLPGNNMPTAMVDEWLLLVTGNKLSNDSIKSLSQSVVHTNHNKDGSHGTAAHQLIHYLQTTNNCEHLTYTVGYVKTYRANKTSYRHNNSTPLPDRNARKITR